MVLGKVLRKVFTLFLNKVKKNYVYLIYTPSMPSVIRVSFLNYFLVGIVKVTTHPPSFRNYIVLMYPLMIRYDD